MKSKIGIVILKDTSHSKVKIIDNKHKNKIIEVVTIEDITVGEKVYIEFKSTYIYSIITNDQTLIEQEFKNKPIIK